MAEHHETPDGVSQFRRRWPVDEPVAALQLVHGIAEHSGRYLQVGRFFSERGFDFAIYDNRGFGRTEGRRGHIDSFELYLDDIERALGERRSLDVPVVLYGHSFGGLMAANYLTSGRPQPDLAVLSAPALDAEVPAWQRLAAPVLGRVAPRLFVPAEATGEGLAAGEEVAKAFAEDPLVFGGGTAKLGLETFNTMKATVAALDRISVPTYVLHGDADQVVPPSASEPLADLDLVTRRSWPGMLHECHNEPAADEVLGEVEAWLRAELAKL